MLGLITISDINCILIPLRSGILNSIFIMFGISWCSNFVPFALYKKQANYDRNCIGILLRFGWKLKLDGRRYSTGKISIVQFILEDTVAIQPVCPIIVSSHQDCLQYMIEIINIPCGCFDRLVGVIDYFGQLC